VGRAAHICAVTVSTSTVTNEGSGGGARGSSKVLNRIAMEKGVRNRKRDAESYRRRDRALSGHKVKL
jgi:hypothetical protein